MIKYFKILYIYLLSANNENYTKKIGIITIIIANMIIIIKNKIMLMNKYCDKIFGIYDILEKEKMVLLKNILMIKKYV